MKIANLVAPLMLGVIALSSANCMTIRPQVVDKKTQLEKQILGSFDKLESELVLASSVRSKGAPGKELAPAQREALIAVMNRQFRKDDVVDMLSAKQACETLQGVLKLEENDAVRANAGLKEQLKKMIVEENKDREVILKRVVDLNPGLSESDLPAIRKMFYERNAGECLPGMKIEVEGQGCIDKPDPTIEANVEEE